MHAPVYNPKQILGLKALQNKSKKYFLFDGGARAGKTWLVCRIIIIRALKYRGTKHLMGRFRLKHAKSSVWKQTLLPMLRMYVPKHRYSINKAELTVTFSNGSIIVIDGFDDEDRVEKIMGTEWATIFINESTQIAYDTFQALKSRLNAIGIQELFILDCNPRAPSHWLHRVFIESKVPIEMKELPKKHLYHRLFWSPDDNRKNLSEDYIENNLDTLTGVKGKRLRHGIWCDQGEGTVYRFDRSINHVDEPIEYDPRLETYTSWDFGTRDMTSIIWYQLVPTPITKQNPAGVIINIIDEYQNSGKSYDFYSHIVKSKGWNYTDHFGDPAGKTRAHDLSSWITKLDEEGIRINVRSYYSGKVALMVSHANEYLPCVRVCETQCPQTVTMFENWNYPQDAEGRVKEGVKPNHDEYSHLGTSFYYFTINKWNVGGDLQATIH